MACGNSVGTTVKMDAARLRGGGNHGLTNGDALLVEMFLLPLCLDKTLELIFTKDVRLHQILKGHLVALFTLSLYFAGEEAAELMRFISFPSAVITSSLNCFIVRRPEIDSGVALLNDQLEDVLPGETSLVAAAHSVYSTSASCAILQLPTFVIPPLILDTVAPLKDYMSLNPLSDVPITTFLLLITFSVGLPCVDGILPQMSKISVEDAESKYNDLGYKEFYYNKGLK